MTSQSQSGDTLTVDTVHAGRDFDGALTSEREIENVDELEEELFENEAIDEMEEQELLDEEEGASAINASQGNDDIVASADDAVDADATVTENLPVAQPRTAAVAATEPAAPAVGEAPRKKTWRERLGFAGDTSEDDDDVDSEPVPRKRVNRPWRLGLFSCLSFEDGAGVGACKYVQDHGNSKVRSVAR
jgi:hypothetical protein